MSSSSSLEGTLALAIKHYRVIVDSRRFIPAASVEEFKKVFDQVLGGLLESLPEAVCESKNNNDTNFVDSDAVKTIPVDAKNLSIATDILKILIILKHFINEPIFADQVLHSMFHLFSKKDIKIVSTTSEFDDHKAVRRFETFLVNLYVLLSDDSSLEIDAMNCLSNLPAARLHTTLLDAAPRASQEEMYRKSYRQLLVNISDVNSVVIPAIIKRLDANYTEDQMIEGVTRKEFLLTNLGWKYSKIANCADRIQKRFEDSLKNREMDSSFILFGHFWILLEECKFVAPDECCSTLFIFPSECESFFKYVTILSQCFNQLPKNPSANQAKALNKINSEIAVFVRKLVKAVSTNYIHFERDLNNRNYQNSNTVLSKIVVALVGLSQNIHDVVKLKLGGFDEIEPSVSSNKIIADFVNDVTKEDEIADESLNYPGLSVTSVETAATHTAITMSDRAPKLLENEPKQSVPLWAIIIAIFCTIFGPILFNSYFTNRTNKN